MNVFICRKTRTMLIRFDMINCGSFDSFEQTQEETRMSGRAWVLAQENDTKWKRFILCRKMANGMSVPNQCEQEIGSTLFHWMGWLNYTWNMEDKNTFHFHRLLKSERWTAVDFYCFRICGFFANRQTKNVKWKRFARRRVVPFWLIRLYVLVWMLSIR